MTQLMISMCIRKIDAGAQESATRAVVAEMRRNAISILRNVVKL